MITMFKSKAGQGKSNEMLRRFMSDSRPSVYITNELLKCDIEEKIYMIQREGSGFNMCFQKSIVSIPSESTVDDYFSIIMRNKDKVLYLDLMVHMEIREAIKTFCYNISLGYGDIYMTEQLKSNAMDGVIITKEYQQLKLRF